MKLKEIKPEIFQNQKEVDFNVSALYFDYEDKEIYDILKQNILNPGIINQKIKVESVHKHINWKNNEFLSLKHKEVQDNYYHFYYTLINSLTDLEKQTLLDIALEQRDKRFAALMIKNPQVKLTTQQFHSIFDNKSSENFALREVLIENKNIPLSVEQVNEGLLKWDSGLNQSYAQRGDSFILKKTIDTLINKTNQEGHWNESVLVELLKNQNLHFDEFQINYFLTSDNFILRAECARNHHLQFTKEQIKNGLNDEGFEREAYDDRYNDYYPSDVAVAFITNPNIKIEEEDINEILYYQDKDYLLDYLIERHDLVLNENQLNRVLEENNKASFLILKNNSTHLNDQQLFKMLYSSHYAHKYITEFYLSRENIAISELALNVLKSYPSTEIKKAIEDKQNIKYNVLKNGI